MRIAHKNTFTLHEACEALRLNDVRIDESTLGNLILDGRFNWGYATKPGGRATVIIFKRPFYEWLREMVDEVSYLYEEVC